MKDKGWVDVTVKWTGRHKFWTSVVAAVIILLILGAAGLDAAFGLSMLLGSIVGIYIFFWVLFRYIRYVKRAIKGNKPG